jgi:hypothetical protein
MAKVKIGMSGLSIPQKIERSRSIISSMTGNANYPTPNPTLAVVKTTIDAMDAAFQEASHRDSVKIQLRDLRLKEMEAVMNQLAAYVQNASEGDAEKILSSGFDVVRRGDPLPPLQMALNLRLESGTNSGKIIARWDKVVGAKIYVVEMTEDPLVEDNFKTIGPSSKTRFEFIGLDPGKKYWVRVAGIGKDGVGPYSDPAGKIAE